MIHLTERALPDASRLVALAEAARPAALAVRGAPAARLLAEAGLRVADISAPIASAVPGAEAGAAAELDSERRIRLEALAWNEALAILGESGAEGTATAAIDFLAEHSGY